MPGRLAIYDDREFKEDFYNDFKILKDNIGILEKRYNIAPTINIPALLNTALYTYTHFGLIPSWANSRSSMNINARCESIFEKKSFRESFKTKRCIIPINGYYEWLKDDFKRSIPYLIKPADKSYFACAGVYDIWYDSDLGVNIVSSALITTEPNDKIKEVHDRMPVILERKDWGLWLGKNSSFESLNGIMKPCISEKLEIIEVGELVNSVKNDSVECIENSVSERKVQDTLF